MWSIDTIDWKGIPPDAIIKKVVNNAHPGDIVLMHVGSDTHTPEALPGMIEILQSRGYKLTTVSAMLAKANSSVSEKKYTVRAGDTLWRIATMTGTTVSALVKTNKIPNPDLIYVGQVLIIPTQYITYTIKPGDTLWSISIKFNTTVSRLVKLNNIVNTDLIYSGHTLLISN